MGIKVPGHPLSPAVQRILLCLAEKELNHEFICLRVNFLHLDKVCVTWAMTSKGVAEEERNPIGSDVCADAITGLQDQTRPFNINNRKLSQVYGSVISTATNIILACLNEKGIEFEFVQVNLRDGDHKKGPFLSLNPFGQVPAFEDEDLKLFESRAITRYIAHAYADKGTPLILEDPKEMAVLSVWQEVEAQRYDPPASKLYMELRVKPLRGMVTDDAIVDQQEVELGKVLDVYEIRLAKSKYLGGDSFTLADLHHLPTLSYLKGSRVQAVFNSRPHVRAWSEDILARQAWQKVVAMQENK